ncbi:hypothetical protein [Streptomyces sp. NPDC048516]|uniref:hypothetical protein n=1 Tax=Streptomyces sp. NPDC048516 TaxID=3365565 RepID=UPI003719318C
MTNSVEAAWRKLLTTAGEPSLPERSPLLEPFAELIRSGPIGLAEAEPGTLSGFAD